MSQQCHLNINVEVDVKNALHQLLKIAFAGFCHIKFVYDTGSFFCIEVHTLYWKSGWEIRLFSLFFLIVVPCSFLIAILQCRWPPQEIHKYSNHFPHLICKRELLVHYPMAKWEDAKSFWNYRKVTQLAVYNIYI